MPLVTLDHVSLAYGYLPLLDDASVEIEAGERICVIGRNGTGKSTLLQVVGGEVKPDEGRVWRQPALRIGRLAQDAPLEDTRPVFDVVSEGLPDLGDDEWQRDSRVGRVLSRLDLPADTSVATLSGGWRRRVLLARALVGEPDVLLLDEPTNHLDIESMTWLETFLIDYSGAIMFVSHDRVFLQRVATRIVELDRGHLTSWPGDYAAFVRNKEAALATEAVQNAKFDKKLAEEEVWLRQGIKARRTRDEGRVRALLSMRNDRAGRREQAGTVRLQADAGERSGQMVIEAKGVSKAFGPKPVFSDANVRVMRGDRVGLIGPNGSGKTTMLRMLIGELEPDSGDWRLGANVQIAYYDQQREQLDPERTVFDTIADGHDMVTVNGQEQHVHGYLANFLFPPERALSPVKALSGGERNRLLLARLFTRPANLLVLDEPTNDLDIETLELLEALLTEWPGTLLLVSHDRAFIDHVVTSTLVFEAEGRVHEYVGGYTDWMRQKRHPKPKKPEPNQEQRRTQNVERGTRNQEPGTASRASSVSKLSFKEQKELEKLPTRIEGLEAEQQQLNDAVAAPGFYKEGAEAIHQTLARLEQLQEALLDAYARWDELDSRSKG
ncbi:MAG: ATP-binding cassette domain-containing protein [Vicinamibacterales bacterium]|nr:ATP-binding cassette domain-containing protein [Vicinamibacterales bacterium]